MAVIQIIGDRQVNIFQRKGRKVERKERKGNSSLCSLRAPFAYFVLMIQTHYISRVY